MHNDEYKRRVYDLKDENSELHKSLREIFHPDAETKLHRFDLFKQVIAKEIKKSRRYGFPLSLLLMASDRYQELAAWLNQAQRDKLFSMLHRAVIQDVRDIDIPVLFAEQKLDYVNTLIFVLIHADKKHNISFIKKIFVMIF